jgi:hypothetical protein
LTNERYPNFKQKNTWEALWVEDGRNSPWVATEITAKAPSIVQFNVFACNPKLTKHVKDGCHCVATIMQLHKQQCVGLTFRTKPFFIEFFECHFFNNNPNAFNYILYNLER